MVGMIGTGGRGKRLLQALTNIADYHVAALCDLREERVKEAAEICEQYKPAAKTYLDFREMLEKEKLDACFVATEEANHGKCVIPVLEADIHCFCEKPMDISVEQVDRVTKAARKSKGLYQCGFQRRYLSTFQDGIGHLHEGHLGKVTFMQGMWHWNYGIGPRYLDIDLSGGWFLAQACHHVDVAMWVMKDKPPIRCVAMGAVTVEHPNPPERCAEDHSALSFEFADGSIFSYTHLMYCPDQFTGEKLWVYAEKGGVDLPMGMKYPRPGMGEPERIGKESSDWDQGTYEELEAFAQHIRNGEQSLSNIETSRQSTLMGIMGRMAMYQVEKNKYEPRLISWEDLGSTT
jgi:predicted dehydrogenase